MKSREKMPEKVLKSPDLGFLEKRGDPVMVAVNSCTESCIVFCDPYNVIGGY